MKPTDANEKPSSRAAKLNSRPPGRKKAILAAAGALFSERGYSSVRMEEIGAAVGISASALYRHFDSKEMIFVTLIQELLDDVDQAVAELTLEEAVSGMDAIDSLLGFHVDMVLTRPELLRIWTEEVRSLQLAEGALIRRRVRAYMDVWCHALSSVRMDLSPNAVRFRVYAVMQLLQAAGDHRSLTGRDTPAHTVVIARAALLADR